VNLDYELDGQWYRLQIGPQLPKVVVGRADGCHLWAPNARSLSRNHCAFFWVDGQVVLVDNNSSAGTNVNNVRVESRVVVPGDIVSAGTLIIFVR
jgi:pSer/pThr/pTyr-binding forkhead associated (FHA) protein